MEVYLLQTLKLLYEVSANLMCMLLQLILFNGFKDSNT